MFIAKKNQIFVSKAVDYNRIRVRNIVENAYDNRASIVTVVNIGERNRAIPGTERRIYLDSVRRRYESA